MALGQVGDDVLRGPTAARHHDGACLHAEEPVANDVRDDHMRRVGGISCMRDAHDRGVQANARRLLGAVEGRELHAILPDRVDGARAREGSGNERLHHQAREAAVAVGKHLIAELLIAVARELGLDRVIAVRRQDIGAQPVAPTFDGRQKRPHRVATDLVAGHQMLFQGDAVELARDGIAFYVRARRWRRPRISPVAPPQQFRLHGIGERRASEVLSPRIHDPHAGTLAELRSKVEAVVRRFVVGALRQRHLGACLVFECRSIHADQVIEGVGVSAFLGHEEDRRGLVRDDGVAVDRELVALGFTAEDRVVVEHQAASAALPLENNGRGEPADPAAHGDQVVHLAGVGRAGNRALEFSVAHAMRRGHHVVHVAVGARVVADAAVAVPRVGRGDGGRLTVAAQYEAGAREERAVQEVAARDRRVHAEAVVTHPSSCRT